MAAKKATTKTSKQARKGKKTASKAGRKKAASKASKATTTSTETASEAASTTAPAKRKGGRPKKGSGPSKSDFVRAKLETGMSPNDIVKAAAGEGMTLTTALVYKLRTKAKAAAGSPKGKPGPKPKGKPGPKPKSNGKISASDLIRQHPDKTARELAELGAQEGVKVSSSLVYAVRSATKKKAGAPAAKPGRKAAAAPKGSDEEQFKRLLASIGIDRAQALLDEAASWGRVFGVVK